MRSREVLIIELNEFNINLIKEAMGKYKLTNFKKILQMKLFLKQKLRESGFFHLLKMVVLLHKMSNLRKMV